MSKKRSLQRAATVNSKRIKSDGFRGPSVPQFPPYYDEEDMQEGVVAYKWLQYMPKIYLRCQGDLGIKHGLLLPGTHPATNTLYVQCLCGRTAQQQHAVQLQQASSAMSAAALSASAGCSSRAAPQLWGLHEWVEQHAGGPHVPNEPQKKEAAESIIMQLPASLQGWDCHCQPLGNLLQQYSEQLGGAQLVGSRVCVDWGAYNAQANDPDSDQDNESEQTGSSKHDRKRKGEDATRGWFWGELISYDPGKGYYTLLYTDGSRHDLHPAICRLHWDKWAPAEGQRPVVKVPPLLQQQTDAAAGPAAITAAAAGQQHTEQHHASNGTLQESCIGVDAPPVAAGVAPPAAAAIAAPPTATACGSQRSAAPPKTSRSPAEATVSVADPAASSPSAVVNRQQKPATKHTTAGISRQHPPKQQQNAANADDAVNLSVKRRKVGTGATPQAPAPPQQPAAGDMKQRQSGGSPQQLATAEGPSAADMVRQSPVSEASQDSTSDAKQGMARAAGGAGPEGSGAAKPGLPVQQRKGFAQPGGLAAIAGERSAAAAGTQCQQQQQGKLSQAMDVPRPPRQEQRRESHHHQQAAAEDAAVAQPIEQHLSAEAASKPSQQEQHKQQQSAADGAATEPGSRRRLFQQQQQQQDFKGDGLHLSAGFSSQASQQLQQQQPAADGAVPAAQQQLMDSQQRATTIPGSQIPHQQRHKQQQTAAECTAVEPVMKSQLSQQQQQQGVLAAASLPLKEQHLSTEPGRQQQQHKLPAGGKLKRHPLWSKGAGDQADAVQQQQQSPSPVQKQVWKRASPAKSEITGRQLSVAEQQQQQTQDHQQQQQHAQHAERQQHLWRQGELEILQQQQQLRADAATTALPASQQQQAGDGNVPHQATHVHTDSCRKRAPFGCAITGAFKDNAAGASSKAAAASTAAAAGSHGQAAALPKQVKQQQQHEQQRCAITEAFADTAVCASSKAAAACTAAAAGSKGQAVALPKQVKQQQKLQQQHERQSCAITEAITDNPIGASSKAAAASTAAAAGSKGQAVALPKQVKQQQKLQRQPASLKSPAVSGGGKAATAAGAGALSRKITNECVKEQLRELFEQSRERLPTKCESPKHVSSKTEQQQKVDSSRHAVHQDRKQQQQQKASQQTAQQHHGQQVDSIDCGSNEQKPSSSRKQQQGCKNNTATGEQQPVGLPGNATAVQPGTCGPDKPQQGKQPEQPQKRRSRLWDVKTLAAAAGGDTCRQGSSVAQATTQPSPQRQQHLPGGDSSSTAPQAASAELPHQPDLQLQSQLDSAAPIADRRSSCGGVDSSSPAQPQAVMVAAARQAAQQATATKSCKQQKELQQQVTQESQPRKRRPSLWDLVVPIQQQQPEEVEVEDGQLPASAPTQPQVLRAPLLVPALGMHQPHHHQQQSQQPLKHLQQPQPSQAQQQQQPLQQPCQPLQHLQQPQQPLQQPHQQLQEVAQAALQKLPVAASEPTAQEAVPVKPCPSKTPRLLQPRSVMLGLRNRSATPPAEPALALSSLPDPPVAGEAPACFAAVPEAVVSGTTPSAPAAADRVGSLQQQSPTAAVAAAEQDAQPPADRPVVGEAEAAVQEIHMALPPAAEATTAAAPGAQPVTELTESGGAAAVQPVSVGLQQQQQQQQPLFPDQERHRQQLSKVVVPQWFRDWKASVRADKQQQQQQKEQQEACKPVSPSVEAATAAAADAEPDLTVAGAAKAAPQRVLEPAAAAGTLSAGECLAVGAAADAVASQSGPRGVRRQQQSAVQDQPRAAATMAATEEAQTAADLSVVGATTAAAQEASLPQLPAPAAAPAAVAVLPAEGEAGAAAAPAATSQPGPHSAGKRQEPEQRVQAQQLALGDHTTTVPQQLPTVQDQQPLLHGAREPQEPDQQPADCQAPDQSTTVPQQLSSQDQELPLHSDWQELLQQVASDREQQPASQKALQSPDLQQPSMQQYEPEQRQTVLDHEQQQRDTAPEEQQDAAGRVQQQPQATGRQQQQQPVEQQQQQLQDVQPAVGQGSQRLAQQQHEAQCAEEQVQPTQPLSVAKGSQSYPPTQQQQQTVAELTYKETQEQQQRQQQQQQQQSHHQVLQQLPQVAVQLDQVGLQAALQQASSEQQQHHQQQQQGGQDLNQRSRQQTVVLEQQQQAMLRAEQPAKPAQQAEKCSRSPKLQYVAHDVTAEPTMMVGQQAQQGILHSPQQSVRLTAAVTAAAAAVLAEPDSSCATGFELLQAAAGSGMLAALLGSPSLTPKPAAATAGGELSDATNHTEAADPDFGQLHLQAGGQCTQAQVVQLVSPAGEQSQQQTELGTVASDQQQLMDTQQQLGQEVQPGPAAVTDLDQHQQALLHMQRELEALMGHLSQEGQQLPADADAAVPQAPSSPAQAAGPQNLEVPSEQAGAPGKGTSAGASHHERQPAQDRSDVHPQQLQAADGHQTATPKLPSNHLPSSTSVEVAAPIPPAGAASTAGTAQRSRRQKKKPTPFSHRRISAGTAGTSASATSATVGGAVAAAAAAACAHSADAADGVAAPAAAAVQGEVGTAPAPSRGAAESSIAGGGDGDGAAPPVAPHRCVTTAMPGDGVIPVSPAAAAAAAGSPELALLSRARDILAAAAAAAAVTGSVSPAADDSFSPRAVAGAFSPPAPAVGGPYRALSASPQMLQSPSTALAAPVSPLSPTSEVDMSAAPRAAAAAIHEIGDALKIFAARGGADLGGSAIETLANMEWEYRRRAEALQAVEQRMTAPTPAPAAAAETYRQLRQPMQMSPPQQQLTPQAVATGSPQVTPCSALQVLPTQQQQQHSTSPRSAAVAASNLLSMRQPSQAPAAAGRISRRSSGTPAVALPPGWSLLPVNLAPVVPLLLLGGRPNPLHPELSDAAAAAARPSPAGATGSISAAELQAPPTSVAPQGPLHCTANIILKGLRDTVATLTDLLAEPTAASDEDLRQRMQQSLRRIGALIQRMAPDGGLWYTHEMLFSHEMSTAVREVSVRAQAVIERALKAKERAAASAPAAGAASTSATADQARHQQQKAHHTAAAAAATAVPAVHTAEKTSSLAAAGFGPSGGGLTESAAATDAAAEAAHTSAASARTLQGQQQQLSEKAGLDAAAPAGASAGKPESLRQSGRATSLGPGITRLGRVASRELSLGAAAVDPAAACGAADARLEPELDSPTAQVAQATPATGVRPGEAADAEGDADGSRSTDRVSMDPELAEILDAALGVENELPNQQQQRSLADRVITTAPQQHPVTPSTAQQHRGSSKPYPEQQQTASVWRPTVHQQQLQLLMSCSEGSLLDAAHRALGLFLTAAEVTENVSTLMFLLKHVTNTGQLEAIHEAAGGDWGAVDGVALAGLLCGQSITQQGMFHTHWYELQQAAIALVLSESKFIHSDACLRQVLLRHGLLPMLGGTKQDTPGAPRLTPDPAPLAESSWPILALEALGPAPPAAPAASARSQALQRFVRETQEQQQQQVAARPAAGAVARPQAVPQQQQQLRQGHSVNLQHQASISASPPAAVAAVHQGLQHQHHQPSPQQQQQPQQSVAGNVATATAHEQQQQQQRVQQLPMLPPQQQHHDVYSWAEAERRAEGNYPLLQHLPQPQHQHQQTVYHLQHQTVSPMLQQEDQQQQLQLQHHLHQQEQLQQRHIQAAAAAAAAVGPFAGPADVFDEGMVYDTRRGLMLRVVDMASQGFVWNPYQQTFLPASVAEAALRGQHQQQPRPAATAAPSLVHMPQATVPAIAGPAVQPPRSAVVTTGVDAQVLREQCAVQQLQNAGWRKKAIQSILQHHKRALFLVANYVANLDVERKMLHANTIQTGAEAGSAVLDLHLSNLVDWIKEGCPPLR